MIKRNFTLFKPKTGGISRANKLRKADHADDIAAEINLRLQVDVDGRDERDNGVLWGIFFSLFILPRVVGW